MFIPSVKSKFSLLALFVISILLFLWVNNSRVYIKRKYFDKKLQAAKLMQKAEIAVKKYLISKNKTTDPINDPYKSYLIGEKNTIITTDRGNLNAKITSLNPNMAAVFVELFKKAKLKKGDEILVNFTSSYPAINLALMSAAKVLGLKLVIISSVGSSMFGMTDPDFTWLDLESYLNDKKIFPYKSIAASIGGGRDLGRGLSKEGRKAIIDAIIRNNVLLVKEKSLEENIEKKYEIFKKYSKNPKLYVNIGGGLSSIGNSISGKLVSTGYHKYLNLSNVPVKGTMFLFAEKKIPVIHILNVLELAERYKLPLVPDKLPDPGEGQIFLEPRYNVVYAIISLAILVLLIGVIILFDKSQMKLKHDEVYD